MEVSGRGEAQARGATGDDERAVFDVHADNQWCADLIEYRVYDLGVDRAGINGS